MDVRFYILPDLMKPFFCGKGSWDQITDTYKNNGMLKACRCFCMCR